MGEAEPQLLVKRGNQVWCLNFSNGRRYIGEHNPFTDPCLANYLKSRLGGIFASFLEYNLKDMGIVDGEPCLLDAHEHWFIVIPTETMNKIGKVLEDLVDTYCKCTL